ncbi:MAG: peptidylprolyl isomerase [Ginsengibacter sp.]|jgi:peptidyl-prolyl cis-trans isomerase A (cyclophilin A)
MFSKFFKNIFFIAIVFSACSQPKKYSKPTIDIKTYFGDIIVELYPEKAPKTVAAFLSYVDSGYYKNTSFYRVLKKEDQSMNIAKTQLIQGGLWQTNFKKQQSIPGIPLETTKQTGILHQEGVISLARNEDPNSGNTEFFICMDDEPDYDYGGDASPDKKGYVTFGRVIDGMKYVKQIHEQPDYETNFRPPIKIINITRLN